MTQRCAQILHGIVENIIIADSSTFDPGDGSEIIASDIAQFGWTYAGGAFSPSSAPPSYQTAGLTFLQFMALFTSGEQDATVASTDTQARLFVLMASRAGSLDLTNAEVVGGVEYLASIGLIASGRVATVLSGAPPA